jgi:hypothetical protein
MAKRGPRHFVVSAERVGKYGTTSWYVELACGHTLSTVRKPDVGKTRMSCRKCAIQTGGLISNEFLDSTGSSDAGLTLAELRARAQIAAHFGVAMDNVELIAGTATVFVDAQHVRYILSD